MANLTNFAEDALALWWRDGTITLPTHWHITLASSAGESTVVVLADAPRIAVPRDLASWSGTQGDGTTLASSGTSHRITNNIAVNFGTAATAWGTANFIVAYDADSGGNLWWYAPIASPFVVSVGLPVSIAAAKLELVLGSNALSDYLANKIIDLIWRGVSYSRPGTIYGALYTDNPTSADVGTEATGPGYARLPIAMNSSNWTVLGGEVKLASTQAYPSPTGDWSSGLPMQYEGWRDAASLGNLLFYGQLDNALALRAGNPAPSHAAQGVILEFA